MIMLLLASFIDQQGDDLEVMALIFTIPYYLHNHKSAAQNRLNIDSYKTMWLDIAINVLVKI